MSKARVVSVMLIVLSAASASGQQDPTGAAFSALGRGEYIRADNLLEKAAVDADGALRDESAFQSWAQVLSFMTNELDPTFLERAGLQRPFDPETALRLSRAAPHDAIGEIVQRARRTNIVILNEAHNSPRSRSFALEVARALRPLGYSILAAEAFANPPVEAGRLTPVQLLQKDGVVRRSLGFFVRDPVFGGFVRTAVELGYRPFAYEQTETQRRSSDGMEGRDQDEADNLMTGIFRLHPAAKVLIYVGYNHVAEAPIKRADGTRVEWMASRLKRATGADPLTIDQATLSDLGPLFAAASAHIRERSAALFDRSGPLVVGSAAGAIDLQVVHPRRTRRFGRPSWLSVLGGRPRPIPQDLLPRSGKRLIQAFAAGASSDAVPVDQVLVTAGEPAPFMMLPHGKFRFEVQQ